MSEYKNEQVKLSYFTFRMILKKQSMLWAVLTILVFVIYNSYNNISLDYLVKDTEHRRVLKVCEIVPVRFIDADLKNFYSLFIALERLNIKLFQLEFNRDLQW